MRWGCGAALLALCAAVWPLIGGTQAVAASAACPMRVAVLGVDMSAGGRFEVQRALHVGAHTVQLDETVADERVEAHGLIPTDLLGDIAVSSALLGRRAPGFGLEITVNRAIRLNTALSYANALLTAGIADAEVGVAAPTSQQALGTTALLGLLRAAQATCIVVAPARADLAIREIVLTERLARSIGRSAAASLLFDLKNDAVTRSLTATETLSGLVDRDASAHGVGVPEALRPTLLHFLHDLVASGSFAAIASAHLSISGAGSLQLSVRFNQPPVRSVPPTQTAPAPSRAGVWRGTVMAVSANGVVAHLRGGVRTFAPAASLLVYRNGELSSLAALKQGDAVTVTSNAAGAAIQVQANGAVPPPATVAPAARLPGSALLVGVALLVVVLLLLVPLFVAILRRRETVRGMVAVPGGATRPQYVPKRLNRAPLKRRVRRQPRRRR